MIKNLIFDMGNVLVEWKGDSLMTWMGIEDPLDRKILTEKMFSSLEWPLLDWGDINEEEAEKIFSSRIPERLWKYIHHSLYWEDMIHPIPHMADFIKRKKAEGYGIYLLSNAPAAMREFFHRIPSSEYFDGIVFSGEVKLVKPMKEIYHLLLDRYALKEEECLFIDDLPINCASACREGLSAYVFRGDTEALEKYLRALNS